MYPRFRGEKPFIVTWNGIEITKTSTRLKESKAVMARIAMRGTHSRFLASLLLCPTPSVLVWVEKDAVRSNQHVRSEKRLFIFQTNNPKASHPPFCFQQALLTPLPCYYSSTYQCLSACYLFCKMVM